MTTLQDPRTQIDDLLDRMAADLQLDDTRRDLMVQHYEAVKNWLKTDEKFFKPFRYEVYPHGSVRTLTTVKPFGRDEFDLDIVVHLKSDFATHTPAKIYAELLRRLGENEIFKTRLEAKNRCVRLNYAKDFHLDILPGIQESKWDENKLMVPDKERKSWVSCNPRGYADWFLAQANRVKESLLEKAMRSENLPVDRFKNKKPLQRAVQLIKRSRDVFFQQKEWASYRTSSIILTTLAGQLYQGEESIFDTVDGIIGRLSQNIHSTIGRLKVFNPVNPQEDFTDKWEQDSQYYNAFKAFTAHLYNEWQKLKNKQGIITEGVTMKGLFGDQNFIKAYNETQSLTEQMRNDRSLGVKRTSGILSSLGTGIATVKPNTFWGE